MIGITQNMIVRDRTDSAAGLSWNSQSVVQQECLDLGCKGEAQIRPVFYDFETRLETLHLIHLLHFCSIDMRPGTQCFRILTLKNGGKNELSHSA